MIIEDDRSQIQILESVLADEDYRVNACQNSAQALQDTLFFNPDLILLDLIMPDMDGFQVCRKLKADGRTRKIPVIFVTSKNDQLNESKGFELGAVDYITKPIDSVVARARIRTHLELKHHQDSLERLLRERTEERDKSQQLLMARNKMASLGCIASGIAHEIRNPLTGITSYLYTLEQLCDQQTWLTEDFDLMKQIVSQLKVASHKMDAVIRRVLDFSRPTQPRMMPIDINQCLENVIQLTAVTLRKAGVQIRTEFCDNLPFCRGDVALVEQVFMNLIQNASCAVQRAVGKKIIEISTGYKNNQVTVAFSDSGPGVPGELRDKIFDPFFTTRPDGSGIGLTIAQRIATDHDGSLCVQDCALGGARFVLTLPIKKKEFSP